MESEPPLRLVRQAEAYKSALLSGAQLYTNMKLLESHSYGMLDLVLFSIFRNALSSTPRFHNLEDLLPTEANHV
jgi:hypothetical protein